MKKPEKHLKDIDQIREIMREIMNGLGFLHGSGIIHRDIKPSNILVDHDQEGKLVLKIIDFSISKVKVDPGLDFLNDLFTHKIYTLNSPKLATKRVTTRPYRAPEVALMQKYDEKIDIWAAGCIFAEML